MNPKERRIFITLFMSIFSAVTGVGIVIPLLPVYAHELGASGLYISMIFGAFSISRTLVLPWFGKTSDRIGRKPFILPGLLFYALVSLGFMLSSSVGSLIGLRFLQGIASGMIMPVAQAYVGDITPKGKEGYYMGLFSMAMFLSLSMGPFMGGFINRLYGLDAAFLGMGVLAVAAFVMALAFLPPVAEEKSSTSRNESIAVMGLLKDRLILALVSFRMVYTTCVGMIWCFLPLYVDVTFGLGSAETGTLVMVMVLAGGLLHIPMGVVADRMNRKLLVAVGGVFIVGSMVLCHQATGFYSLLAAVIVFGIGGGTSLPALSALAVERGREIRGIGSVMSLLTMAHSLGMLLGSLIAGLTMDLFELRYAFPMGGLIMAAGLIHFTWLSLPHGQKTRPPAKRG
ncbi:MFS transporter [Desulfoluna spongiiphila]|uniref:Predicted arabinose efflux permease, MFS family n=1 Tax=Desulfoluna spongiiphila TaxID=419481 RepID=A0A1G5ATA8_9BACT|nr:MFS transporter [Desulfoluna spongiiphila]SCX81101.1 Predicted arabinose efflux permease, MFS family [Desulfoluna spongiiphila]VVS91995.1 tetracycline resistance protein teta/multidrug resistance protein mdtg [Desulfoluna spongiiphila]